MADIAFRTIITETDLDFEGSIINPMKTFQAKIDILKRKLTKCDIQPLEKNDLYLLLHSLQNYYKEQQISQKQELPVKYKSEDTIAWELLKKDYENINDLPIEERDTALKKWNEKKRDYLNRKRNMI